MNKKSKIKTIHHENIGLLISSKHRVYIGVDGNILNPARERLNNLPLNSDGLTNSNKFINVENTGFISGGIILINTIPEYFPGGNTLMFAKCLSNVNNTLSSDLANFATSKSSEPKTGLLISNHFFSNNSTNFFGRFSSHRSLNWFFEYDIFLIFEDIRSITKSRKDGLFIKLWEVIFKNLSNSNSCSKQFGYLPNHDSCTFKSRSSTTNFTICNDIFVDFDSHITN